MRWDSVLKKFSKELPNLLIIDDSEDIVEFISELFSKEYRCINASDGQAGVDMAIEAIPDIILCDVRMPKISGLDVVRILKDNPKTRYIPIILLSGYNTRENRLNGLRAKADDFLAKPFDYEELSIKMSNLLQIRQEIFPSEPVDIFDVALGLDAKNFSEKEVVFLTEVIEYLSNNYSNKDVDVNYMAEFMELSVRQLQRKVKAITTFSPMDLLRIFRLKQSAHLLLRHNSISEVSEACGFSSPNYFCTCFKEFFQITPSQFQKTN